MKIKSKNYNYGPIGQRIRNTRIRRQFTQRYLADKLDVSCRHISDIERGLNGMSVPALMDICKILEVDADYILFGTETRLNDSSINRIMDKLTPNRVFVQRKFFLHTQSRAELICSNKKVHERLCSCTFSM